jgi:hypothetical protein
MTDNAKATTSTSDPIQVSFNDRSSMDGHPNLMPKDYNLDTVGPWRGAFIGF